MKLFLRIFILSLIIISPSVFAEDKAENVKGKNLKVAIVNFQKVVVESDLGKKFIKSQRSNIEKKQSILGKLEDQVRKMRDSYEEKRLVLDEKARDEMGEELAYKIKELQRKREDFERHLTHGCSDVTDAYDPGRCGKHLIRCVCGSQSEYFAIDVSKESCGDHASIH